MTQLLLPIIYLAFISLGLPDSLLGSAWPSMYPALGVPVSYAGLISMIISFGTIVSSLNSDRLTRALGTGKVTALSVGTTIGPVVMGTALSGGLGWNSGYRYIALFQIALTAVLFCSLPLWHKRSDAAPDGTVPKALTLPQVFALPGAKEVMLCFFCYCALETTAGLWASSYLTLVRQVPAQTAASFASLFYIGITVGRGVCGFLTLKLSDDQMIRLGFAVLGVGIAALLLPGAQVFALAGLVLVGLGCAPIYPSVIHSTPAHFGVQNSQAVIGIQMSSAYVGNLAMPPLFGVLANNITPALFPFYLLVFLMLMALMHRQLVRKTSC